MSAVSIPIARAGSDRATGAYLSFLLFVVAVYSSAAALAPPLEKIAPGKTFIALAAVALAWSCVLGRRPFRIGLGAGGAALYGFFALLLLSPLWSVDRAASLEALGEDVKYLAAFVIAANVLDTPRRVRTFGVVIALSTLFPAIGTIHSYFVGENLVDGTRAAWIGNYVNPNFVAYNIVVSAAITLALRESAKGFWRKTFWLGVLGIFAVATLLTQSRGGALGFLAVVLLWTLRSLAHGRFAVGALVAAVVALLMTPLSPLNREDTRENLSGQVDASAQGRVDAWRTAMRIVEDRPVTGVGIGAFVPGYELYAPGDAGPARTAHNSFVMVAAELGLPALLLFVLALYGSLSAAGRLARDRGEPLARATQTGIFGFVICSMTGSYPFSWPLFFALGLCAAIAAQRRPAHG